MRGPFVPSRRTLALTLCGAALASLALASPASSSTLLSPSTLSLPPPGPPDGHDPRVIHDGHPRLALTLGWMSIMAWILVYNPQVDSFDQIWLCYKQQSGDGLSLVFLFIWLTGDITNLLGSLWQGLIPTVIILAVYYTACDVILISQKYYYHHQRELHPERYVPIPIIDEPPSLATSAPLATPLSENTPLLSAFSAHAPTEQAFSPALQRAKDVFEYTAGFVLVAVVGVVAWFASKDAGRNGRREEVWDTRAQVVGWLSAFLYLGSRLPQLALNRKTKCEGLSLLMFAFAVIGNGTYVASILLTSLSPQHLLVNAPWLLGSGGTIFLDFVVLGQFAYYASARRRAAEMLAGKVSTGNGRVFADDEDSQRREVMGEEGDEA